MFIEIEYFIIIMDIDEKGNELLGLVGGAGTDSNIDANQVNALLKAGLTYEQIAQALGVSELDVKQIISATGESAGYYHGEFCLSNTELALLKAKALQLATTGANEGVQARMVMFLIGQASVSNETRFKAERGLKDAGGNINNIMIAINTAKEKAAQHG